MRIFKAVIAEDEPVLRAELKDTLVGSLQADAASIANIRERLGGLEGTGASLQVVEPKAGCIEARLDIPLDFAPDSTGGEVRST